MRGRFVELLGWAGGLTATALISSQLGSHGRTGVVVTMIKYHAEDTYRLELQRINERGHKWSTFGLGSYGASDFSEVGRYRHLSKLLDVAE